MAYHIIGKVSAPFLRKTGKKPTYYYYVYDEDRKRVRRSTGMHSRAAAMQVIQERIATGTLISDTLISTRMGSGVFNPIENDEINPIKRDNLAKSACF